MKLIYCELIEQVFTAYYVDVDTGMFYHKEHKCGIEICTVIAYSKLPSHVGDAYINSGFGAKVENHVRTPIY